jgi:hypothetical protein
LKEHALAIAGLGLDNAQFTARLVDWAVDYGFKIDGDYINIEDGNVSGFIDDIDSMFESWADEEKVKVGKIEK